jgi:hypothetical protein
MTHWLLMLTLFTADPARSPTFVIVPTWVLNWVSLPEADESVLLTRAGKYRGLNTLEFDVDLFKSRTPVAMGKNAYLISVLVDFNYISLSAFLRTLKQIRSGWDDLYFARPSPWRTRIEPVEVADRL